MAEEYAKGTVRAEDDFYDKGKECPICPKSGIIVNVLEAAWHANGRCKLR